MIKNGLVLLLFSIIVFLGLSGRAAFLNALRDPVPSTQKVAHSSHCAGCHGFDATGQALVDGEGEDVSIFSDWQISMMGFSARDPFWRATLEHEVSLFPSAKTSIENTCLRCHAPLGSIQAQLDERMYSFESMLEDSLGLDGVSCSACHQQPAQGLGQGHSGFFTIDTNRVLYGPYPNPFQGPMQLYVGFDPVFSDHIYSSGICAGCHTLITETLQEDGTPSGDYFVEQATYHEWLNSVYPAQGKECQTCHMPFIQDSVIIATDFLALKKRHPFGLHQFFGANTVMLELMEANKEVLGLPTNLSAEAWNESIENNRFSLSRSAEISLSTPLIQNDTLYIDLTIKNKTGHKLPSGYPSRLVWVQVLLQENSTGEVFYENGTLDADGNILGRDFPFEPHHQVSYSAGDVQIYEMVMSNLQGHMTTRLNAAYQPLKDNRLLPVGFRSDHQVYDTVAVWGSAGQDPHFSSESTAGLDRLQYRIPLDGRKGFADLDISLRYQSLPSKWMEDLFSQDTLSYVAQFKIMYQSYKRYDEIIDRLILKDLDLSATALPVIEYITSLSITPNPSDGTSIQVVLTDKLAALKHLRFEIYYPDGKRIQSGRWTTSIIFSPALRPGLYYFLLRDQTRVIAVKPFTIL